MRARGENSLNSSSVQSTPDPRSESKRPTTCSTSKVSAVRGPRALLPIVSSMSQTVRNQAEESASVTQSSFNCVMREVVQHKMRCVFCLLLPRCGTIFADAAKYDRSVWLL